MNLRVSVEHRENYDKWGVNTSGLNTRPYLKLKLNKLKNIFNLLNH